ncbi:ribonuclease H-like domain-containing protein [Desulfurobacterium sp.]
MSVYFVFDIETIKDNLLLSVAGSERDKEKAENGEFLNPVFHKPICFSFMAFRKEKLLAFKTYVGEEVKVVKAFWETVNKIIKKNPVFVTFNGRNFDFPVMLLRGIRFTETNAREAIKYYLNDSDKWENNRPNYTSKFSKYHIDLIEVFGIKASLHALCSLYGIPVKTQAHGSNVEELYANGNYEKIAMYCAEDVLATTKLLDVYLTAKTGEGLVFLNELKPDTMLEKQEVYE